ncbi:acyltransferase family protein [Megasphaera butyrica]|uniref:acyltransferase n=1 Tax=Megasphaera butyrica TaxID=2981791 RepID=UPI0008214E71|nr:acyltransferase family protein [Megasphaera butyrica]MCU6715643.1 acyltransferase family protein [Megasphaera butyrica]SCI18733.1 Inner membrane protein YiaH [uncultured Megasphaera sp.]SCJ70898.1 Inner membrane protein YiaH [uncultured Ruminococcus sp.]
MRIDSYDLLRTLATFSVVLLHLSGMWITDQAMVKSHELITLAYIYNDLSRYAVPCFIMISGALVLRNDINSFREFYKKSFIKLGIPTLIFSIIYTIYNLLAIYFLVYPKLTVSTVFFNLFKGIPMYHMWFMYMFLWIYAFAPFVKIIKGKISQDIYIKVSIIFFVAVMISSIGDNGNLFAWDIGEAFKYLSYFIMGDVIYIKINRQRNNKAYMYISFGILIELYAALSASYKFNQYLGFEPRFENIFFPAYPIGPLTVLAAIASVCMFIGFTMLNVREMKFIRVISDYSFYIYLIHALVIEGIKIIFFSKYGYGDILNNLANCQAKCNFLE